MEAEHDNVRAALAWSVENDPDGCVRLAAAAHPFRELRGHLTESRRWLETAVARENTAPALVRAEAFLALGRVASLQGDAAAARGYYERGLPLAKEVGDTKQVAVATYIMGTLANAEGDLLASRAYLEESLAISREAGYVNVVIPCLNSLGEAARLEGDSSAARAYYEQAVADARGRRQDHYLIIPLCNLGAVACDGDDVDAARACFEEALDAARALGSQEFVSQSLDGLAAVAAKRGAWERAGRLAGAAEALLESIGATLPDVDRAFRERYLADVRERYGGAGLEAALAHGRAMTPEQAVEYALSA
jgi:non-specific serine/threonine protein kinase